MQARSALVQVVDDDVRNSKLIETLLAAEGYETLLAHSGVQCLEQHTTWRPALILLDVMMPGMDGFETAARLKADVRTHRIPVIMVTSLDDRESRLRGLQAGAEEFLTKPVDRAELAIRVRNILRLKDYQNFLEDHARKLEQQVAVRTAALRDAYKETIYTMVRAAEFKDEQTGRHVQRISHLLPGHGAATRPGFALLRRDLPRQPHARHRQDRDTRFAAAETRPLHARGVGSHEGTRGVRRPHSREGFVPVYAHGRRDCARPP